MSLYPISRPWLVPARLPASIDEADSPQETAGLIASTGTNGPTQRARCISTLLSLPTTAEMLHVGFHRYGGLIEADELASRLRRHGETKSVSRVARWIVDRDVVTLVVCARILLPRFQFDEQTMTPIDHAVRAIRELRDVLDDMALADWFARPNCWLHGKAPAEALHAAPGEVFEAARTDRFILHG